MIQRCVAFLSLMFSLCLNLQAGQSSVDPAGVNEAHYLTGLECLKKTDIPCATVVQALMPPASPYAKLLQAQLSSVAGDWDNVLRLLIPLQAANGLIPEARISLHTTLGDAYEAQGNVLYALEQGGKLESLLSLDALPEHQARLWTLISGQPRAVLVEMRGESADPVAQGWIDLALAASYADNKSRNVEQWRTAYPDHPVTTSLLAQIVQSATVENPPVPLAAYPAKIGLLLPLDNPMFQDAAQAVKAGFMAAIGTQAEVKVYSTGNAEAAVLAYQQAITDGVQFVVGPLTREETTALVSQTLTVPVLFLNLPDTEVKPIDNLYYFGLSVEGEVRQLSTYLRAQGVQTALVVTESTPLGRRMELTFVEHWRSVGGNVTAQLVIPEAVDKLGEIRGEARGHAADIIFLAAGVDQARKVRPYLDAAIPTYGTSHVYDGTPKSDQNLGLEAVHFVDMPWMVTPERTDFSTYERTGNINQSRFYALGLDAARVLPILLSHPQPESQLLEGATGSIMLGNNGILQRKLPMVQFLRDQVRVEHQP